MKIQKLDSADDFKPYNIVIRVESNDDRLALQGMIAMIGASGARTNADKYMSRKSVIALEVLLDSLYDMTISE